VYHKYAPHPSLQSYVDSSDPENPELPADTFYFFQQHPWVSAPGQVTHIVALLASTARKQMLIYFELFSTVPVAVLLPYNGAADARATYAVDVLTGAEVQATIDEDALKELMWQSTHQLGEPELYRLMRERIGRLIGLSQELAWNAQLEALKSLGLPRDTPRALAAERACRVRVEMSARSFSANAANRCRTNGSTSGPSSATRKGTL
jgi:hypothetical protein